MSLVKQQKYSLRVEVAAATLARLILNISQRMMYPFLPAIARGMGISLESAGLLMTLRSTAGVFSPIFGPVSDRVGRRKMMLSGLAVMIVALLIVVLVPQYAPVGLAFVMLGLAKVVYDPSLHAYFGDRVPYQRRGRVVAVTELAWAGSFLVGIPAAGWMIENWGWQTPFLGVAVLGVLGLLAVRLVLTNDGRDAASPTEERPQFLSNLSLVLKATGARGFLAFSICLTLANELLFIVYGDWMETRFDLSVARLGLATMVIGGAELAGELSVGGLVDRLGKRRSVAIGLTAAAMSYMLLPIISVNLALTLVGLFALFFCFEFTIVSSIPLATEVVPAARATMMSLVIASSALGRALGALLGPRIWQAGGMATTGVAAGCVTLLALVLLLVMVKQD